MTLADLQNGVQNLSDNLLKLNNKLTSSKLSKSGAFSLSNQINNIKSQIQEKEQKISLILKQPFKMNIADEDDNSSTPDYFGESQRLDDMPVQNLDEVPVSVNRTEYFINKYKFYILGAIVLIFLIIKKK
jgi:hypothetical protein